MIKESL